MAQVLIRRLDEETVQQLKRTAKAAGHSLEQECRQALDRIARADRLTEAMDRWAEEDAGRGEETNPWSGVRKGTLPRVSRA